MKDVTDIVINAAALSLASKHGLTVVVNRTDNVAHPRCPKKTQASTLVTFSDSFVQSLSDINYKPSDIAQRLSDINYKPIGGVSIFTKMRVYLEEHGIDKNDIVCRIVYENGDSIPELSIYDYADRPTINGVRLNCLVGFIYENKADICKEFGVKTISETLETKIEARMEAELAALNEFAKNDLYTLTILKAGRVVECVDFVRYTNATETYANDFSKCVTDFIETLPTK